MERLIGYSTAAVRPYNLNYPQEGGGNNDIEVSGRNLLYRKDQNAPGESIGRRSPVNTGILKKKGTKKKGQPDTSDQRRKPELVQALEGEGKRREESFKGENDPVVRN